MDNIDYIISKARRENIRVAFVYKLSFFEPLGIGYLSAYLKKHFPSIKIELFDPNTCTISNIKSFCPTLVLYSMMSGKHMEDIEYNMSLKRELDPFISVFGGPHPTYFPEMIEKEGVDIICRGEGEKPLKTLVDAVLSGSDIRLVNGLWVKRDGKIYKNNVGSLIENLDDLPFPDRTLYYKKSKWLQKSRRKSMSGARGCVFKCSYCYNSGLNELYKGKGKIFRSRTPQSIVEEARLIKSKHNTRFIYFVEDIFAGINLEWLKEFCELYARVGIPFTLSMRAEFVKPDIARYLKKSGCVSANVAIESGDYEYRKKYLFRNATDEMLIDAIKLLESEGIRVSTPIMLGLPFTDINDDLKSLKLVCKAKPTFVAIPIFHPYPNTALANICLEHGLIKKDYFDNLSTDFYTPAHIKNIDYEKVLKIHSNFFLLMYMNRWLKVDVEKWFRRLPNSLITRSICIVLRYLAWIKIVNYKRGAIETIREIFHGLITDTSGIRQKKRLSS